MSLPPVVAVAVNPETQTSEPIVVVSPDAPSQMVINLSCAHANYCSLALVTPPALMPISHAQTSQLQQPQSPPPRTTMMLKPTPVPDRSQVYVHAPQRVVAASCQCHQQRASRTVGKVGQQNLRVRAPRVSHRGKVVPSGMRGRPCGQTPARLPAHALTHLPAVFLERLSWPRGRKAARRCRGNRIWCCRRAVAATSRSWMAWGHRHAAYILRTWYGRRGRDCRSG